MTSRIYTNEMIQSKEDIDRLFIPFISSLEFLAKSLTIFEIPKSNHTVHTLYCERIDTLVEFLSRHTKKAYPISSSILASIFVFHSRYNRLPEYEVTVAMLRELPEFEHTRFGNASRVDLLDRKIFRTIQVNLSTKLDIKKLNQSLNEILSKFHDVIRDYRKKQPFYDTLWLISYVKLKTTKRKLLRIGKRRVKFRESFIKAGGHYGIIAVEVGMSMSEMTK